MATYYVGLDLGQGGRLHRHGRGTEGSHLRPTDWQALNRVAPQAPGTLSPKDALHRYSGPGEEPTHRPSFTTPVLLNGRVAKPITELIVDKTGVGVAVTDLLKERRLNYIAVTITGLGQKANRTGTREYSVPKQDLVSALEVPFHKGNLKVAKGLEGWPKLREELLNFRRKQNKVTAHISYEHWRESDHDDLVLAAALACWKATYRRAGTTRLRVIR